MYLKNKLNKLINKNNFTNYIIYVPIISIIFLSLFLFTTFVDMNKSTNNNTMKIQKEHLVNDIKENLREEVSSIVELINYSINNPTLPEIALKNVLLNTISNMTFKDNGYFYIVNGKGKLLAHRNHKLLNTNAFKISDPNGLNYMKEIYFRAIKQNVGFIKYISITNEGKSFQNKNKLTFYRYYAKFDWVICAGAYTDDIDNQIITKSLQINNDLKKRAFELFIITVVISLLVLTISIFLSYRIKHVIDDEKTIIALESAKLHMQILEQKRDLRENLGFSNKLLEILPMPLFIKDKDFKYIRCNDAYCRFVGLSKSEIIGKKSHDILPKQLADISHENDQRLLFQYNIKYKHKFKIHDKTKVAEFYKTSYEHNYQFAGIIGVIVDITEQEKYAHSLKQEVITKIVEKEEQTKYYEKEQLKNAKFTSIGQLAAGITHEINTPLTYIKGNFEMMGYDIEDLPPCDIKNRMLKDKENITDGITRIANIVEAMREMSQKSKEIKENVDIYKTLIIALRMAHNRSKQVTNIHLNGKLFNINFDWDDYILNCHIQKQRVEQVWVIIINNALDELVKIDDFENRQFNIIVDHDREFANISFIDNAGGIPDDMIDTIFDPFISNKESSGMGIGLNVAKGIVEDQDGSIEVYNTEDRDTKGAVFTINLPLSTCDLI